MKAKTNMKTRTLPLLGLALLLSGSAFAQLPEAGSATGPSMGPQVAQAPMTDKEVLTELKKDGPDQLMKDVEKRGVNFEMDADMEKRLRKAKATDDVIKAVTAAGPKERENAAKSAAQASGAVVVPPEQSADFKALQTELDPDKAASLAAAFIQKYPNSPILNYAYAFEANAYEMKGDVAKVVEFAQKSVDVKKDTLMSLLMLAYAIPTPQYINQHQADEEKQLTDAESDANQAVTAIQALKKQPNETDEDFAKRKTAYLAEVHADMGMIHLDRAQLGLMGLDKGELAKAEQEYRLAVTGVDRPDPSAYYRLGEACRLQGKFDEAIEAFTKADQLGQGAVKQYAEQQIEKVKQMKAQAGAAPKP
jgi:tetratricopeptide (TPR) repeat protein